MIKGGEAPFKPPISECVPQTFFQKYILRKRKNIFLKKSKMKKYIFEKK